MTSVFWQDASLRWWDEPRPDAWKIAQELPDLFEGVLGDVWRKSDVSYEVVTKSGIRFEGPDIVALQEWTNLHKGPLSLLAVAGTYRYANDERLHSSALLHFDNRQAAAISLTWASPQRVDIESARYSLSQVVDKLKRRKSWKSAEFELRDIRITTSANAGDKEKIEPPAVKANGLRPRGRRWFIRNRDNLIISLGGGFIVSTAIVVLQLVGAIPVPG
ncbi:hypothetical protein [Microbacterium hydrocarbonoxydans]|uniref:hypothetical protein n=1 Tax=Microbacterium hydrocarbonoxydans TaxID=273678 RepID=UPI00203C8BE7|nr:hypothetical protein [Microbacterium hydrocarbonoxydans]MCM3778393.1 hypothetical protein [Microbacterium hydrocarbonoxydans]